MCCTATHQDRQCNAVQLVTPLLSSPVRRLDKAVTPTNMTPSPYQKLPFLRFSSLLVIALQLESLKVLH